MTTKRELYFIFGLLVIHLAFSILQWGFLTRHIAVDTGREAYIPQAMIGGAVLYKDILNIYGPFSYQLNALLFILFGSSLTVLYVVGIVTSLLIVLLIYLISRNFLSTSVAFFISLFLDIIYILFNNLYTIPYSYAIIYAVAGLLATVLFTLQYVKTKKDLYLYLAFFFIGLSLTNKYDFIAVVLVPIFAIFYTKKFNLKTVLLSTLSFALIPLISSTILVTQGVRFYHLKAVIDYIVSFSKTNSLAYFYNRTFQDSSTRYDFSSSLSYFIVFNLFLVLTVLAFYLLQKINFKKTLLLLTLYIPIFILFKTYLLPLGIDFIFSWLPIFSFITTILAFRYKNTFLSILSAAAFLATIKALPLISHFYYGAFLLLLAMLTFLITAFLIFKKFLGDSFKLTLAFNATIAIFASMQYVPSIYWLHREFNLFVFTDKGMIRTISGLGYPLEEFLKYANVSIDPTEKVLVLPEGQLLNFLSDRKTDDYLSAVYLPPSVEAIGEDVLINRLNDTKIDYIAIIERNVNEYLPNKAFDESYFGVGYAKDTYNYILTNYTLEQTFGANDFVKLYKLKQI